MRTNCRTKIIKDSVTLFIIFVSVIPFVRERDSLVFILRKQGIYGFENDDESGR